MPHLTPGMSCLTQGQGSLRSMWAKADVKFRGELVSTLINKTPTEKWRDGSDANGKAKADFLPKGFVTITLFKDQFDDGDADPRVGEAVLEDGDTVHRIQELHPFELHWLLLCKSSPLQA